MLPKDAVQTFISNKYHVTKNGIVYGRNGKPLTPSTNAKGYQIINICINGKRKGIAVHTIVARAFCNGYTPEKQVNHKNGNKCDNNASNLEWVTPEENRKHAIEILGFNNKGENNPNAKPIKQINTITNQIQVFNSIADCAKAMTNGTKNYRYIQNNICRVLKGQRNTYKGYTFEYV